MAILKIKDARKLTQEEKRSKLQDLRFELIKSNVTAQKSKAKTKEIKRTIARLLTLENSEIQNNKAKEVSKK